MRPALIGRFSFSELFTASGDATLFGPHVSQLNIHSTSNGMLKSNGTTIPPQTRPLGNSFLSTDKEIDIIDAPLQGSEVFAFVSFPFCVARDRISNILSFFFCISRSCDELMMHKVRKSAAWNSSWRLKNVAFVNWRSSWFAAEIKTNHQGFKDIFIYKDVKIKLIRRSLSPNYSKLFDFFWKADFSLIQFLPPPLSHCTAC